MLIHAKGRRTHRDWFRAEGHAVISNEVNGSLCWSKGRQSIHTKGHAVIGSVQKDAPCLVPHRRTCREQQWSQWIFALIQRTTTSTKGNTVIGSVQKDKQCLVPHRRMHREQQWSQWIFMLIQRKTINPCKRTHRDWFRAKGCAMFSSVQKDMPWAAMKSMDLHVDPKEDNQHKRKCSD
jgi:hypothetical protein